MIRPIFLFALRADLIYINTNLWKCPYQKLLWNQLVTANKKMGRIIFLCRPDCNSVKIVVWSALYFSKIFSVGPQVRRFRSDLQIHNFRSAKLAVRRLGTAKLIVLVFGYFSIFIQNLKISHNRLVPSSLFNVGLLSRPLFLLFFIRIDISTLALHR